MRPVAMQLDDAATNLSHADFFEVCDAEQRRLLAFASERKKYRPGSIIYKSGDVPDGAHVLRSLLVCRGGAGSLLGYERRADQGPWLVSRLLRWWHRNTVGYLKLDPGAGNDGFWEAGGTFASSRHAPQVEPPTV